MFWTFRTNVQLPDTADICPAAGHGRKLSSVWTRWKIVCRIDVMEKFPSSLFSGWSIQRNLWTVVNYPMKAEERRLVLDPGQASVEIRKADPTFMASRLHDDDVTIVLHSFIVTA